MIIKYLNSTYLIKANVSYGFNKFFKSFFLVLLLNHLTTNVKALECYDDDRLCDIDEYCLNGLCVTYDALTAAKRLENEIFNIYDKPLSIHKYNIDYEDDYDNNYDQIENFVPEAQEYERFPRILNILADLGLKNEDDLEYDDSRDSIADLIEENNDKNVQYPVFEKNDDEDYENYDDQISKQLLLEKYRDYENKKSFNTDFSDEQSEEEADSSEIDKKLKEEEDLIDSEIELVNLLQNYNTLLPKDEDEGSKSINKRDSRNNEEDTSSERDLEKLDDLILRTDFQSNEPIIYENSGIDEYGNRFYEKEIIANDIQNGIEDILNNYLFDSDEKNDETDHIPASNKYTEPESAINFFNDLNTDDVAPVNIINKRRFPGLGPFYFKKESDNTKNFDFISNSDEITSTDSSEIINHVDDDSSSKKQEYIQHVQDLVKEVSNRESNYLSLLSLNKTAEAITETTTEAIDNSYIYIELDKKISKDEAENLLNYTSSLVHMPFEYFKDISVSENLILFKIESDKAINLASLSAEIEHLSENILHEKGWNILSCRPGIEKARPYKWSTDSVLIIVVATVCASLLSIFIGLLLILIVKRRIYLKEKNFPFQKKQFDEEKLIKNEKFSRFWPFRCNKQKYTNNNQQQTSQLDYTDLCRSTRINQTSPLNNTETTRCDTFISPITVTTAVNSTPKSVSPKIERKCSSASSWSDEPLNSINMDVKTGHVILSYMEEHLNDKNRLSKEWDLLSNYVAEPNNTLVASNEENMNKNRYSNILPYDHNRVKLEINSGNSSDYINASFITDNDPKNPAYIATQGPLTHTTGDFWRMVWEQNSVVIVSLCRTVEYGSSKCNHYWPTNGFETYDNFEVHLVSEHVWCEDYLVRSFYLKNKITNQTRTVTQFHFLTWPENGVPPNVKSILDFRRKVNKSYNRKSFPIIVHCNDGVGRTGTFILIDMILNKIMKEAKEIDLAATLEFLRDQRIEMIKQKNQFEFSFAVITEEVHNMLKALMD